MGLGQLFCHLHSDRRLNNPSHQINITDEFISLCLHCRHILSKTKRRSRFRSIKIKIEDDFGASCRNNCALLRQWQELPTSSDCFTNYFQIYEYLREFVRSNSTFPLFTNAIFENVIRKEGKTTRLNSKLRTSARKVRSLHSTPRFSFVCFSQSE